MEDKEKALLAKYLDGTCTTQQKLLVESWYNKEINLQNNKQVEPNYEIIKQEIWNAIHQNKQQINPKNTWVNLLKIAAIFLITGTITLIYYNNTSKKQIIARLITPTDIMPGSNKAILTLDNGKQISLDNAKIGNLAMQGLTIVSKTKDGELLYKHQKLANQNTKIQYNTIATPKGGQYHIILPDGTGVWLNSVSTIRFPTIFNTEERNVEITGEVYFEVAKDKKRLFNVIAERQKVSVLGTHFNINTYKEESVIKTTLIEGSIKVANTFGFIILTPGQQSQVNLLKEEKITVYNNADVELALAWKEGFFMLDNADVKTIMREAARWYDVEIIYEGEIPNRKFSGEIRRNVNISRLIKMLNYFKLNCRLEGRKIIVAN